MPEARVVVRVRDQLPDLLARRVDGDVALDPHQPSTGRLRSSVERGEGGLHLAEHQLVRLVDVHAGHVDRLQHLHRDLRGQRDVPEHVAHVQAPRERQRDRQHLQPEHAVEPEQPRDALAAREEEGGLLAADRHDRNERDALRLRQPDEAAAAAEVHARGLPGGPVHLVVAARVDEQRRAAVERLLGVLGRGRHRAVLAQAPEAGHGEHEVVGELVEAPLHPEVGAEGEREDVRVRREVAAGVVPHQQHRPLLRDVLQAAHLGPEVEAREHPEAGERLADVVGVALVEVGARHAALGLLGHRGDQPAGHLGERRRRARPRPAAARAAASGPAPFEDSREVSCGHAARLAAGRITGQLDGGPCGRLILCGSPGGRPASRARISGVAQLLGHGALGRLDHVLAPLRAHPVAAHRRMVLGRRLDDHDLRAEAAHLALLALEPAARGAPGERPGSGRAQRPRPTSPPPCS